MLKVYCYSRCTTCKKALKWLDENGVEHEVGRPSGTERNISPSTGALAGRMSMRARTRAMEPRSPAEP